jgi:hypothetical protein
VKICQPNEKENTASQCLMALSFFENSKKINQKNKMEP